MEDKRAQTLEALSTFLEAQKSLLARTQADIERLRQLKDGALSQPSLFISNLSHELNASAFKLSEQLDCANGPPDQIDWSLFMGHDPTPLHTLASTSRLAYAQRNEPNSTQRAPLSDLQKLVKSTRLTLVDPILSLHHCSDPSSEEDDTIDPEQLKRERERDKIRALKGRKISTTLGEGPGMEEGVRRTVGASGRSRGPSGVFIRRDVEDESAEVNIDVSFSPEDGRRITATSSSAPSTARPTPPPPPSLSMALAKSTRIRRPSTKLQIQEPLGPPFGSSDLMATVSSTAQRGRRKAVSKAAAKDEPSPPIAPHTNSMAAPQPTLGKRLRDAKPKPETYKQAWSVEEQHMLEKLLDEIPDGEKNRWQKISLAMKGRRTPRQVASRVQKYFEKLKRFGVGVDGVGGEGG